MILATLKCFTSHSKLGEFEMLLGQEEFDQALEAAQALHSDAKSAERELARRFHSHVKSESVDLREFAQILLLAYLAKPYRIRLRRNSISYRKNRNRFCRFTFNLEPFRYETIDSLSYLLVDEDDLFKPIALKDYLSRRFYCDAQFSFLQFGCLEVGYHVPSLPEDWALLLSGDDDFRIVMAQLSIKQYS